MNTTFPSIQPILSWRSRRSRLIGAFLVACVFTAGTAKAEAEYTFTRIADSAGPLADFHFASPSLNATGTVAFLGTLDNGWEKGVAA